MPRPLRAVLASLAITTLAACGGDGGESFQLPGPEGTALPYTPLKTVAGAQVTEVRNGGFGSAMAPHPSRPGHFYALTDRGPNAATAAGVTPSGVIFVEPTYHPRIGLFRLDEQGQASPVQTLVLKDRSGRPVTGLPNRGFGSTGETPYGLDGRVITLDPDGDGIAGYDESGIDGEGLVAMADGSFWVSDEYGPHLVHFDAEGREIERINPFAQDARNRGGRVLPAELSRRWPNRGMEGLTLLPDGKTLVGIMQSSLYNPSQAAAGTTNLTRIVTVHTETGAVAQYLYRQDAAGLANSEIAALSATRFLVIERDTLFVGRSSGTVRKNVYRIDLAGATNVDRSNSALAAGAGLGVDAAGGLTVGGRTLEQVVNQGGAAGNFSAGWAELEARGIRPVAKTLVYDAVASLAYPHDKMEGLWVIDANRFAMINDDDFALEPDNLGGIRQKVLGNGKVDSNILRVIRTTAPLF